ncbi:UL39 ribonucleotide reductase, large subunit [Meleagrid alphaherpesvirus 1]|uniref:Ribonucleoside-diphosphate reductase large subunit n=1 Tax=Meleagrid herpesvirus 1 TaxID=37108 RepID=Q9DH40_MEHV1|nr:ribonucleotide reductase subunit 1 [Meleagrid alphaherpesvirus 1]AKQ48592.1 ribonucleotide reductase subunit 1 [iBAC vector pMeHV1-C7]AKQ48664.1 ribonucleotide reductase subunit 1 [iBAC vector pMeHV1-C9]AKQ48736.1 ribonucleotide reductase subunit 1 [iBAC vector pMeHV1-C10]AKQ48808.1 ribonucleotide reductase subunit 1 [iBAC vector pMeHV1-C17]AKQ48880.1 ribonucleotide reductase subunit 1 [iBAC vector pMeHV1-C18]
MFDESDGYSGPGKIHARGIEAPGTGQIHVVDASTASRKLNDMQMSSSVATELYSIERQLLSMDYLSDSDLYMIDVRKYPETIPSISDMRAHITRLVNKMKPICRFDERLYSVCGELVHLRIASSETTFDAWLTSKKLNLKADVLDNLRRYRAHIEMDMLRFYGNIYPQLKRLGLQSALKYEEYLVELEGGKKESLCQFFIRLAAAAATEALHRKPLIASLTNGSANWRTAFTSFFLALAHQLFVPSTPCMLFLGREGYSTASCYLMDPRTTTTQDTIKVITNDVVPHLLARGGIGISLQHVNQKSGLMHVLKLIDSLIVATNVNESRPTGVCVYLEPWHSDIMSALTMRGMMAAEESRRCDNVFLALWACDLLFKRYLRYVNGEKNVMWTLFDSRASILSKLYGDKFEVEYERLEKEGIGVAQIPIRDMMFAIIKSAASTGSPFILFKDACNRHYITDTQGDAIAGSNLCTEIIQKTNESTNGVCTLASINLARCVRRVNGECKFDFDALRHAVRLATVFTNAIMDGSDVPTVKSQSGRDRNRSIGIGVQGFHTAMLSLGLDLEDGAVRALNKQIFELMLLEAMTVSCEFCERGLPPFPDFSDSYYAQGRLHFDGWDSVELTAPEEWGVLRGRIMSSGLYNAQFIALMPTAASAQVTEVSEGFAPLFSNMFSKVTSAGELLRPNSQLMRELRQIYPDNEQRRLSAITALESTAWCVKEALGDRPECTRLLKYKTAFEYDQSLLIDLCADRAPFVDQSQSMTLFVTETADGTLLASRVMNLLLHAYKAGLKTGMYYCKIRKATNTGIFSGDGELTCSSCVL